MNMIFFDFERKSIFKTTF